MHHIALLLLVFQPLLELAEGVEHLGLPEDKRLLHGRVFVKGEVASLFLAELNEAIGIPHYHVLEVICESLHLCGELDVVHAGEQRILTMHHIRDGTLHRRCRK